MHSHEAETTVGPGGSVRIERSPFPAGVRLKVIMTEVMTNGASLHSEADIAESARIRSEIAARFRIKKYERPNEPVGLEDWEILRNDDPDTGSPDAAS
jgi:hypothetical protein